MSWGISASAPFKEKIKSEVVDILDGMNSCGKIDYNVYSELFDAFLDSLDKMSEFKLSDCDDSGFVIYDKTKKLYYCGLKQWDKSLRKAQIYHSRIYVKERIDDFCEEIRKSSLNRRIPKSLIEDINDLVIRKIAIFIEDTYDLDEFNSENEKSPKEDLNVKSKKEYNSERRGKKAQRNLTQLSDLSVGDKVMIIKTKVVGRILHFNKYTDDRYLNYSSVTVEFEKNGKVCKRNYSAGSLVKLKE